MPAADGNRWHFFFGCFHILRDGSEDEEEEKNEKRRNLIEILNKSTDLHNVSDLFEKTPLGVSFNPIVADIHIPFSLQRSHKIALRLYGDSVQEGHVEDFRLIYDGTVLIVAASSPIGRRPWGVYDARDRFSEILKPIIKFEEVPPCLTHEAVIFINEGEAPKDTADIYVKKKPSATFLDMVRDLYTGIGSEMSDFYVLCWVSCKMDELILTINQKESSLLSNLEDFLKARWKDFRKRRKLVAQARNMMLQILKGLSAYTSSSSDLDDSRKVVLEEMRHNNFFNSLISKIGLNEYTKPSTELDIASSMRIMEHVRLELETYSANSSTIVSALIGAIIGSVITIVATYFLRLI